MGNPDTGHVQVRLTSPAKSTSQTPPIPGSGPSSMSCLIITAQGRFLNEDPNNTVVYLLILLMPFPCKAHPSSLAKITSAAPLAIPLTGKLCLTFKPRPPPTPKSPELPRNPFIHSYHYFPFLDNSSSRSSKSSSTSLPLWWIRFGGRS